MQDKLFTAEALATLAGASFLTYLVVAYTKSLIDRLLKDRLATDLYAVMVACVIVLLAQFATGASPLNWVVWFLSAANGFLVAATAGKMNDKAVAEYQKKASRTLDQDVEPGKAEAGTT